MSALDPSTRAWVLSKLHGDMDYEGAARELCLALRLPSEAEEIIAAMCEEARAQGAGESAVKDDSRKPEDLDAAYIRGFEEGASAAASAAENVSHSDYDLPSARAKRKSAKAAAPKGAK